MEAIVEVKTDQWNIELISRTVAKGASQSDLAHLIYLAQQYNLDPMKKEIYYISRGGGQGVIVTGRDGYLKCANDHAQFDGIEGDVVYEGDKLRRRDDGSIHIEYGDNHLIFAEGALRGAFCNVYRKDRAKSATAFVNLDDYNNDKSPVWQKYTGAMILKVAESMALKRAFALSGLVTHEEMGE